MSDVITALKRLERAGSEDSRQSQKLRNATVNLEEWLKAVLPYGELLPRGYEIRYLGALEGWRLTAPSTDTTIIVDQTSETALAFARDIASGWLEDLACFLEDRGAESATAAETLAKAAEAMRNV